MYEGKGSCLIKKTDKEYVSVDWGMKDILPLFWNNDIETLNNCYGHIKDNKKSIAWIQVGMQDFGDACRIIQAICFDKPLCVFNKENKLACLSQYDGKQLFKWEMSIIEGYTIITLHE